MATEVENTNCPQCKARPGERHREWDDIARCRSTGEQLIQCPGEEHEFNGRWYGEHAGPCGPDVWDGEYPGVKFCRQEGWESEHTTLVGEKYWGADLNFLASVRTSLVEWDPDAETYHINDQEGVDHAYQRYHSHG